MRNTFLYITLGVLFAALLLLMISGRNRNRIPDQRITLKKKDKIPYGSYVAYRGLPYIFPNATIAVNKNEPAAWDSLSETKRNQALLIVAPRFLANEEEMLHLIRFAQAGNDIFISARGLSMTAQDMLKLRSSISFGGFEESDTLMVQLNRPPFVRPVAYQYPGKKFDTYLFRYDSTITSVLGHNRDGDPNFVRFRTGEGNIYLHLAPLAFSNYFLLYKENREYYEKILSVISVSVNRLIWDEYFYYKFRENGDQPKRGWLDVLLNYDSFRAAFWTLFLLLVVYVLMEMRRKQRIIPVWPKPVNDSLEFVKTIGRMYYDRKDHRNLCRKMASYFLEHIRSRYKLPTGSMNEKFVKDLHLKSGYDEKEIKEIVSFIVFIDQAPAVSDSQLANFYKQLESFYKNT